MQLDTLSSGALSSFELTYRLLQHVQPQQKVFTSLGIRYASHPNAARRLLSADIEVLYPGGLKGPWKDYPQSAEEARVYPGPTDVAMQPFGNQTVKSVRRTGTAATLASNNLTAASNLALFGQGIIHTVTIDFSRGLTLNSSIALELSRPDFVDGFTLLEVRYNRSAVSFASASTVIRSETVGGYAFCGRSRSSSNRSLSSIVG